MHMIPEHPYRIRMGSNAVYLIVRLAMLRDALNVPFIWIWPDKIISCACAQVWYVCHRWLNLDWTVIRSRSLPSHLLRSRRTHGAVLLSTYGAWRRPIAGWFEVSHWSKSWNVDFATFLLLPNAKFIAESGQLYHRWSTDEAVQGSRPSV